MVHEFCCFALERLYRRGRLAFIPILVLLQCLLKAIVSQSSRKQCSRSSSYRGQSFKLLSCSKLSTYDSRKCLAPWCDSLPSALCFSLPCYTACTRCPIRIVCRNASVGANATQVGQLTWTIVTICMIVAQLKFIAHNIFHGIFWFFFPASLVICNDSTAYFW